MHLRRLAQAPPDTPRPALVVQGGGLRGIYSMAALTVLEELGLRNAFSMVIGSSAGAINGAYFLAGQAAEGLAIYLDELTDARFLSLRRPWKILDVDYLVDVVLKQRHRLDLVALREARTTLYAVLTDAESATARTVGSREVGVDLYEVFRATAAMPVLYNRRVEIDGRDYVDGGVSSLLPLREAFSNDASEAVVLLTRSVGYRQRPRGWAYRAGLRLLAPGQSRRVKSRICDSCTAFNAAMDELRGEHEQTPRRTWTVWPSDLSRLVSRTTNDRSKLRACAEMGRADMFELLDRPRHTMVNIGPVSPPPVRPLAEPAFA